MQNCLILSLVHTIISETLVACSAACTVNNATLCDFVNLYCLRA